MNYQKLVCWGDSQSFGARTYGCYPLYLAQKLNHSSNYTWSLVNQSANGRTARDLWFCVNEDLLKLNDFYTACILIGANDIGNSTPVDLFTEYYQQMLNALKIAGIKSVYCGEIPQIWPDGHAFFSRNSCEKREHYNERIKLAVDAHDIAKLVQFPKLTNACFVDPVHFNETGNNIVADAFAQAIMDR